MGLHLNFDLRLDASTPAAAVHAMLADLYAHATTLPFERVSPFIAPAYADSEEQQAHLDELQRWASIIAEAIEYDATPLTGDTSLARGFFVHPGRGCESASFGLFPRLDASGATMDWYWHCSCKTQYASAVSDAHLIACHTGLVRLIDLAVQIGFQVEVRDETHYWETRDESRLLKEVHAMNWIVAAFAGRMSDAVGSAHRLESPIFDHPRFERLEMGEDG